MTNATLIATSSTDASSQIAVANAVMIADCTGSTIAAFATIPVPITAANQFGVRCSNT